MSESPPREICLASVVVLYRPDRTVLENIASYRRQVQNLIAVDNSEEPDYELHEELRETFGTNVVANGTNLGIATALNIAARDAIAREFDFLLTMDQDSRAEPDMVEKMLRCLNETEDGKIGIISPFHITKSSGSPPPNVLCQEVMTPMTSGCLLNLAAYQQVGPFRDDLFIDFVDNEYCLRLRQQGFRVLRANEALLKHSVGDTHKFGPFIATNHSPLRRYYKTRNRFLTNQLYRRDFPGHCLFDRVRLVKEIVSIILFEEEKLAKLRMMWRGYRDYRRRRFGKYQD